MQEPNYGQLYAARLQPQLVFLAASSSAQQQPMHLLAEA